MKLVQVENGQIVKWQLPKTGKLKDGRTVSGYDLLPLEILSQEGWLPLEDNQPEYDVETQYLINDGYEILSDKVVKKYKVEDIVIQEPIAHIPSTDERLEALELVLLELL